MVSFQGGGHLPHCVDGLPGGVFGLAIQILYAALGLLHLATDLCLGIADGASKGFLYFSSQIFGSSTQAISDPKRDPHSQVRRTKGVGAYARDTAARYGPFGDLDYAGRGECEEGGL
jgi:hypothetical protein